MNTKTAPALTEWVAIVPLSHWQPYTVEIPSAAPVAPAEPAPAPEPRVKLPRGWEAECREEYDLYLMYRYLAAEESTVGYFLNDRAPAGLVHDQMFYRPWSQVRGYASEELLAWIADNGETMTYTAFRAQYRAGVEVLV